jgi:hypothetical protein
MIQDLTACDDRTNHVDRTPIRSSADALRHDPYLLKIVISNCLVLSSKK